MSNNCPSCGSPITDDSRFCSHCGCKLPDNIQRIEIITENKTQYRYEDAAKLEEIRLRYEHADKLEEIKRQEKKENEEKRTRGLKILCLICWAIAILFLLLAFIIKDTDSTIGFVSLFLCAMVSGIVIGVRILLNK